MWKFISICSALILLVASYYGADFHSKAPSMNESVDHNVNTTLLNEAVEQNNQPLTAVARLKPHWLNNQLKDRLDAFSAVYEQGENLMWQQFNQECLLFDDCQGLRELFTRYLAYKKSLVTIDGAPPTDTKSVIKRMDDLLLVREQFFTFDERELLFGTEQAWDEAALHRLQIKQDPNLDREQKRILLEANIAALPDELKRPLLPTLQLNKLAVLRQRSPARAQSYNELAAEFGPEAAQRLSELHKQRESWQQKLSDYQTQISTLSAQYDASELSNKIQEVKNELFTANEQKRLAVIVN